MRLDLTSLRNALTSLDRGSRGRWRLRRGGMPEAIDLRPDWLAEVRCILRNYAPGRAVWAFGSRARGRAKPYSDLDLAILGRPPLPDRMLFDLKEAFDESDLPFAVDVVDWAGASGSFRRRIAVEHTLILEGEE